MHVVLVQVADQGVDDTGRPGALGFYLLILPADLYRFLGGNPFQLADQYPPLWDVRETIEPRICVPEMPPNRTVDELAEVLKGPHSATTFGGAQALLDGGRLLIERDSPDEEIVRQHWKLLPTASRCELWPTSFAFGNNLGFHVLVTPSGDDRTKAIYVSEENAGDYPEGRYEFRLQAAVDANDQREVDRLLSRRSPKETLRLGFLILILAILLPVAAGLISGLINKEKKNQPAATTSKSVEDKPKIPEKIAPLATVERQQLRSRLVELLLANEGKIPKLNGEVMRVVSAFGLAPSLEALTLCAIPDGNLVPVDVVILALDRALSKKHNPRKLNLSNLQPAERRLRGLLWKYRVPRYDDLRLSARELMEHFVSRLEE